MGVTAKEEFIQIYQDKIKRQGSQKLLDYLTSDASDFFTAPSSTRFHGSYEGGLVQHSLNVYHCLVDYLARPRTKELYGMDYSEESVALVALLHDICKLNFYTVDYRNTKI
ncbi:MAG: hydrolase, partial [Ruminococcus sp.]|nr:hydrolase [Ruminococcus sp.]